MLDTLLDTLGTNLEQKAGMISGLSLQNFGVQDIEIANILSSVWFVSHAAILKSGKNRYPHLFLKPTDTFKERFNFSNEILCIFHPYPTVDGRILDAIDKIVKANNFRIDRLCIVLITNAETISDALTKTEGDNDPRIIVPFKYKEMVGGYVGKEKLMSDRFEQNLYTKDLFAISSVLKTDRFFFGRQTELQKIVGQYQNGENGSVFGLRRIGKSSLLWAAVRQLKQINVPVAFIDCADPGYHRATWNKALFRVKEALFRANTLDKAGHQESEYSEENATLCFADDLLNIKKRFSKPSYLIFDEVENLCFDVSLSEHWKNGSDFLLFWQALRSTYQQHPNIFSFLICGTNPHAIETARLPNGADNPIYKYIEPHYLGFFGVDEVEKMIAQTGSYMGVTFDREIYTYLTDDFGGHPFLIKQVCSYLRSARITPELPRKMHIRKEEYQQSRAEISAHTRNYIELILEILTERYPKEFALLKYLAAGDEITFNYAAEEDPQLVEHLYGYGLLNRNRNRYSFRIKLVEAAVKHDARELACPDSLEERWALISKERNQFEHRLREIVRQTLKISLGPAVAKTAIISCMRKQSQIQKANANSYDDIFKGELYFLDLKAAVLTHWDKFKFAFNDEKNTFGECLDAANKYRSDAHAKTITRDQFKNVMPKLVWLTKALDTNA